MDTVEPLEPSVAMTMVTIATNGGFQGEPYYLTLIQIAIATSGIITNLIVVMVLLKDEKLRAKIPNICIINQVGNCRQLSVYQRLNFETTFNVKMAKYYHMNIT